MIMGQTVLAGVLYAEPWGPIAVKIEAPFPMGLGQHFASVSLSTGALR